MSGDRCAVCDADLAVRADVTIRQGSPVLLFCGPCYRTLQDRLQRRVFDELARCDREATA